MASKGFHLKIASPRGGNTYIYRDRHGDVHYISGSETPLSLSNLILDDAAMLRFKLERVATPQQALQLVKDVLSHQWRGNPSMCPHVEVV